MDIVGTESLGKGWLKRGLVVVSNCIDNPDWRTSKVNKGDKIRIIDMKDIRANGYDDHTTGYNGRVGVVTYIDSTGQIHGTWGGLALVPGIDEFEVIK